MGGSNKIVNVKGLGGSTHSLKARCLVWRDGSSVRVHSVHPKDLSLEPSIPSMSDGSQLLVT